MFESSENGTTQMEWADNEILKYNTNSNKAYRLVTDKGCGINIAVKHSSWLHLDQNEYCMFPSVVK